MSEQKKKSTEMNVYKFGDFEVKVTGLLNKQQIITILDRIQKNKLASDAVLKNVRDQLQEKELEIVEIKKDLAKRTLELVDAQEFAKRDKTGKNNSDHLLNELSNFKIMYAQDVKQLHQALKLTWEQKNELFTDASKYPQTHEPKITERDWANSDFDQKDSEGPPKTTITPTGSKSYVLSNDDLQDADIDL
jgi:exonuclease VII large subunit